MKLATILIGIATIVGVIALIAALPQVFLFGVACIAVLVVIRLVNGFLRS